MRLVCVFEVQRRLNPKANPRIASVRPTQYKLPQLNAILKLPISYRAHLTMRVCPLNKVPACKHTASHGPENMCFTTAFTTVDDDGES